MSTRSRAPSPPHRATLPDLLTPPVQASTRRGVESLPQGHAPERTRARHMSQTNRRGLNPTRSGDPTSQAAIIDHDGRSGPISNCYFGVPRSQATPKDISIFQWCTG